MHKTKQASIHTSQTAGWPLLYSYSVSLKSPLLPEEPVNKPDFGPIKERLNDKNRSHHWLACLCNPLDYLFAGFQALPTGHNEGSPQQTPSADLSFAEYIQALPMANGHKHIKPQAAWLQGAESLEDEVQVCDLNHPHQMPEALQKTGFAPEACLPSIGHRSKRPDLPSGLEQKLRHLYLIDYMLLGNNDMVMKPWSARTLFEAPVVVVFYDANYETWFKPWMRSFKQKNKLTVVPIFLKRDNDHPRTDAVNIPWDGERTTLWKMRMRVLWGFIACGVDLFHLDLGIRVYGDLMSLVDPQTDMAFGQGTIYPLPIARKYGVVACGGTFFIRSNQRTKQFFTGVTARCEKCGDDQVALNEALFADNPDVIPPKHERKHKMKGFNGIEFSWNDQDIVIVGQGGDTIAKIWSMHTVARLPRLPSDDTVVWHPTHQRRVLESLRVLFSFCVKQRIKRLLLRRLLNLKRTLQFT